METTKAAPLPSGKNIDPLQNDFEGDLVGNGEKSFDAKWPHGKKIAVSFVLNYEEGGERSLSLGDETHEFTLSTPSKGLKVPYRCLDIESEYDYGARVGVWRILRLFKEYGYPLTGYVVGKAAERNPDVMKAIIRDGHEIASHAYQVEKSYIINQLETIKKWTGEYPQGWYYVVEVYKELGVPLSYISDYYGDDIPRWIAVPAEKDLPAKEREGLLLVPYSYDCNHFRFLNPNGFRSNSAFLEHLISAFTTLHEEADEMGCKMMTVGLHCRIAGKPGYFQALKKFIEYINQFPDVWVCRRKDIADHFRENPYSPS
ncbi:possibe polysaccharide deacetylase [Scheffersomyces xylosifermentans]|uniref:possibe polysaccharide deacetylase n=1 Tax=Scheffersomyces xylosifermentans TaxID=1304137 RepID=UPI00315CE31A